MKYHNHQVDWSRQIGSLPLMLNCPTTWPASQIHIEVNRLIMKVLKTFVGLDACVMVLCRQTRRRSASSISFLWTHAALYSLITCINYWTNSTWQLSGHSEARHRAWHLPGYLQGCFGLYLAIAGWSTAGIAHWWEALSGKARFGCRKQLLAQMQCNTWFAISVKVKASSVSGPVSRSI